MRVTACIIFFCSLLTIAHAGNVDTINVFSSAMHKDIKCVVITPANYKKSGSFYPVVYLLHGYAGNYARWLTVAPQLKNKAALNAMTASTMKSAA